MFRIIINDQYYYRPIYWMFVFVLFCFFFRAISKLNNNHWLISRSLNSFLLRNSLHTHISSTQFVIIKDVSNIIKSEKDRRKRIPVHFFHIQKLNCFKRCYDNFSTNQPTKKKTIFHFNFNKKFNFNVSHFCHNTFSLQM